MAGYLGSKAVLLSTTAANVTGNADIGGDLTVDTNTLYVDSTNNRVGIGTTSPSSLLSVGSTSTSSGDIALRTTKTAAVITPSNSNAGGLDIDVGWVSGGQGPLTFSIGSTERMRIDSSGNLLVGMTSANTTNDGAGIRADGLIHAKRASVVATFNRKTSDGTVVQIAKDNTVVGNIGVTTAQIHIETPTSGNTGLDFRGDILPRKSGALSDGTTSLGATAFRFDDIYATNGTIQTSDANEKQQIASLTAAELTAAKTISGLFKTFKWNDSVAEKGDAARIHNGVIAQEVEQALTDAGLDAGDYAFFISTTWWETQTEVPAVEAVDEVLDEEGNVVVEAVEAQEAYTRTDTYDTLEEAPEGATERNRKGIRYPELLSFIHAATEQRLASIEARLDALEGV